MKDLKTNLESIQSQINDLNNWLELNAQPQNSSDLAKNRNRDHIDQESESIEKEIT